MSTEEEKKLRRLQARRRSHLKAAVLRYAKVFDVSYWFQRKKKGFTSTLAGANQIFGWKQSSSNEDQDIVNTPLRRFEECGTTCCIAGLDYKRSGRTIPEQRAFYGFVNDHVYLSPNWPKELFDEYQAAKEAGDFNGMAVAANKAIDYFAVK